MKSRKPPAQKDVELVKEVNRFPNSSDLLQRLSPRDSLELSSGSEISSVLPQVSLRMCYPKDEISAANFWSYIVNSHISMSSFGFFLI